MGILKRIAAAGLAGIRWVLLAMATGIMWLADLAKDASKEIDR